MKNIEESQYLLSLESPEAILSAGTNLDSTVQKPCNIMKKGSKNDTEIKKLEITKLSNNQKIIKRFRRSSTFHGALLMQKSVKV